MSDVHSPSYRSPFVHVRVSYGILVCAAIFKFFEHYVDENDEYKPKDSVLLPDKSQEKTNLCQHALFSSSTE